MRGLPQHWKLTKDDASETGSLLGSMVGCQIMFVPLVLDMEPEMVVEQGEGRLTQQGNRRRADLEADSTGTDGSQEV